MFWKQEYDKICSANNITISPFLSFLPFPLSLCITKRFHVWESIIDDIIIFSPTFAFEFKIFLRRGWNSHVRGVKNLIHSTLSWEVTAEFVAQSSNFTLSSSSYTLLRRQGTADCRSPWMENLSLCLFLPPYKLARKYTFAKSAMTGRSGMSMNRNPCSSLDDPPRSPSYPIPSPPPFLFLSISALSTKAARGFQIHTAQWEQSNHCLHDRVIVVDPHLDGMMIMQTPKFDRGIFTDETQHEEESVSRLLPGDDKRQD